MITNLKQSNLCKLDKFLLQKPKYKVVVPAGAIMKSQKHMLFEAVMSDMKKAQQNSQYPAINVIVGHSKPKK